MLTPREKAEELIQKSNLISRDLSWLQFNYRVLDQAKNSKKKLLDRLKFMAITASNLDEFFMIRVGSLYNYLDYGKERTDYSGLREEQFKQTLFHDIKEFITEQNTYFRDELEPHFGDSGFRIIKDIDILDKKERADVDKYFMQTVFPMLTPMLLDFFHPYPVIMNKLLVLGVVIGEETEEADNRKMSFIQIPQNLPRFFEVTRDDEIFFVPVELVIKANIDKLFRNVELNSISLFRVTRNGDFTLEENEDIETDFVEEIKRKLKTRKTGRVVRVEVEPGYSEWMMKRLMDRWNIDDHNFIEIDNILDLTGLWQIVGNKNFKVQRASMQQPVMPLTMPDDIPNESIFSKIKKNDIFLHHPFNNTEPWLKLLEASAEDPNVLAIKMTIYRLADDSRVTTALKKAAENGKYVSVLFEIKARFDEENNINEGEKLREAGCFVIYGTSTLKTHSKALMVVRKEGDEVCRYVHLASGNYNEDTAKLYTDIGMLTADKEYTHEVAEFFNAVTGFSRPDNYKLMITAPHDMRNKLVSLVEQERENAKKGLTAGIAIKVNSLQDKDLIKALYKASQAGVQVKLIVRGICCVRPERKGLSENIEIRSLVGELLEHSRVFYFHNDGDPVVIGGSADAMVRSFDRRVESLFVIKDKNCKKEAVNLLRYNLKDNVNSYKMGENGDYKKMKTEKPAFNTHKEFYKLSGNLPDALLF